MQKMWQRSFFITSVKEFSFAINFAAHFHVNITTWNRWQWACAGSFRK